MLLEFDGLGAKVVRVDLNFIEVTRLVGEGLWDDMLLREVERAHGPMLVTLECADGVNVAHPHPVANVALEHLEKLQELLADALHVLLLIDLVVFSHLFKTNVRSMLDIL